MFSGNKWDTHLIRIFVIVFLSYLVSILYLLISGGDALDLETVILVSLYVILISLGLFALIIALNTNVYGKNKMVNDISGAWTKNRISPSIRAETDASRRSEHKESASFILSMLGALAINYVFLYILQF